MHNWPAAVEALIEFGADVNSILACGLYNETPLAYVINRDNMGLLEVLVKSTRLDLDGMCGTADGFTSLGLAVERGRNDMIRILAECGCDLNKSVSPKDQCSALVCACTEEVNRGPEFKLNPTVATLIECGADIHAVHNIDGNKGGAPGCPKSRGAWHRALEAKNVGAMAQVREFAQDFPEWRGVHFAARVDATQRGDAAWRVATQASVGGRGPSPTMATSYSLLPSSRLSLPRKHRSTLHFLF